MRDQGRSGHRAFVRQLARRARPGSSDADRRRPGPSFSIEHTLAMQSIEGGHESGVGDEPELRQQVANRCRPAERPQRIKDTRFKRAEHSLEVNARGVGHPVIIGSLVDVRRTRQ